MTKVVVVMVVWRKRKQPPLGFGDGCDGDSVAVDSKEGDADMVRGRRSV